MKNIEFSLTGFFMLCIFNWILLSVFQFHADTTSFPGGEITPALRTIYISISTSILCQISLFTVKGYKKLYQMLIGSRKDNAFKKTAYTHPAAEAILERVERKFNNLGNSRP